MSKLVPKYSIWEAINTSIALGTRALHEIRTLARTPGPRGADGLGFDDLQITHDGERTFTFKMIRGKEVKEDSFVIPCMIYRSVWREQPTGYQRGDVVTWGGSTWVALKDTTEKPDSGGASWQLAVKKGRDGRDIKV
jgi:hypothetical protein